MSGTVAAEIFVVEIFRGLKTNGPSKQIENFRKLNSVTNSATE